jgi:methyl-accepting chemotaxis protein
VRLRKDEVIILNFNNLRIATKLWIAVGIIMLALASLLAGAGMRAAALQEQMDTTLADLTSRAKAASKWSGMTETNAARTLAIVTSSDPAVEAAFKGAISATTAQISEVQKTIEGMRLSPDEKAQMEKIAAHRKAMIDLRTKARQMKADGKAEEAVKVIDAEYNPAVASYLAALRELVAMEEKSIARFMDEVAAARATTTRMAVAFVILLVAGLLVGTLFLIRSIRQPLMQANSLASRIAKGDLSMQVDTSRADEFGDLMRSLSSMNDSLGQMVSLVRQTTDSIATASSEIATGNNDLAQRTEQTSSNLQSTASSMDELTSTVQQSADNARTASSLAANASSVAERGGAVVQQVVSTMEEINASSKRISDIIGVIDGIAFQTNILALNAAVEAARAGEQGRGFAVVASEVRSLAQRSAEAAKEIKSLIGASVERVESGTRLVTDAGSTMSDIVQSVRRVAEVIGEITAAASEQSSGIAHVNQAIGNLDQMTQQNAALVEQSAAAAESLREQSEHLAQAVAVFKVRDGAAGPARMALQRQGFASQRSAPVIQGRQPPALPHSA